MLSEHDYVDFDMYCKYSVNFETFSAQVTESDVIDVVEIALKRHSSDVTTRAMSLVALLKLSSRFPTCSE